MADEGDYLYERIRREQDRLERTRKSLMDKPKVVDLAGRPVDPDAPGKMNGEQKRAILERLAGLPQVDYEMEAQAAATALGIHPSRLDRAVEARRAELAAAQIAPTIDSAALYAMEHSPVAWAVRQVLPEGVTLLIGKPKVRKSFLALSLALAVAHGGKALGHFAAEAGDVLYLSLEDNERRLTKRLHLLSPDASPAAGRLTFATDWPRLGHGGIEAIEAWIGIHPERKLLIMDTLARMRPDAGKRDNAYDEDYAAGKPFIDLCKRHAGLAILIVHHARKAEAEDPIDAASGTLGLTGGVDGFLVLSKAKGQMDSAILHVDGRDIEEPRDLPLVWSQERVQWELSGDPVALFGLSDGQRKVYSLLQGAAMSPDEIMAATGISEEQRRDKANPARRSIYRALDKLAEHDLIDQVRFDRRWQVRCKDATTPEPDSPSKIFDPSRPW